MSTDEAMIAGYDGMLCGLGALASKVMVAIARAVDQKNFPEAVNLQNTFIRLFRRLWQKTPNGLGRAEIRPGQTRTD